MGSEVVATLCREGDMEPVGAVSGRPHGESLELPDGSGSIPLSIDLQEILSATKPQVLVDFTTATVATAAAGAAAASGVAVVSGTTGLSDDQLRELDRLSREYSVGIISAPNFALGAVLLQKNT
jgi:4-hydroxy-tetrahydrodipicolinate reductase